MHSTETPLRHYRSIPPLPDNFFPNEILPTLLSKRASKSEGGEETRHSTSSAFRTEPPIKRTGFATRERASERKQGRAPALDKRGISQPPNSSVEACATTQRRGVVSRKGNRPSALL